MHIAWVHEWQEEEGSTDATNLASALIAQAEATLAVAEQLRVANILALDAPRHMLTPTGESKCIMATWVPKECGGATLRPEVKDSLRIGEGWDQ